MTKSRKKMLLSSIAMLLVALVALGSATYAWYVTNSFVTASESQFKAATADGLVIKHSLSDATWASSIDTLLHADSLNPASINYADSYANIAGAKGEGTTFENGQLKDGTLKNEDVEQGSFFLVDEFYVASSTGSSKEANFTVTCSTVDNTYLNLAIYVGGVLQTVLTSDSRAGATGKIVAGSGGADPTVAEGTQAVVAMNNNTINNVDANKNTFTCPSKDTNSGLRVQIVAFADGFNSRCTSATANTSQVKCTYKFTAVE